MHPVKFCFPWARKIPKAHHEERTAAYEQYVAQLKTPRLRGSVIAMAERAAYKALESKSPLEDIRM